MKCTLIFLIVLLGLTACGLPPVREVRYTVDTFEPTASVEVLHAWPRERQYLEIAELG